MIPLYASIDMENFRRSAGFILKIFSGIKPNIFAVHTAIAALALYVLTTLILILHYFEKTPAPELPFCVFFILSLSFESVRLILPLEHFYNISSFYLLLTSKILLFSRNFGLFSLFAASVYAAGLETKKQRNFIFINAITALIIALGTPVDTFTWKANLEPVNGYASIFYMLNIGLFLITIAGFLIAAYTRKSREYIFISLGTLLALTGRNILLSADAWIGLAGIVLLFSGTGFICIYLHKVYL